MKKGYHDYIPIVKEEVKEEKVREKGTHEPKYIKSHGGLEYMISDDRGMVVASTDVLMFGSKLPASYTSRPANTQYRMSTKDYIKYNGRL